MRCSICGAKLKKEGEVCSVCYKEFQEDEELRKDKKETLKFKRKYSINYEILRYMEIIIIFILCMFGFLISGSIGEFFITLFSLAVILGVLLFWDKRVANGTTVTFYEKKVVYRFKFFIFNTTKVVKFTDIDDIVFYQTFRQKKMGMGDICIYAKGSIPGANLLNGFQVKDVENLTETLEKIKEVIGVEEK